VSILNAPSLSLVSSCDENTIYAEDSVSVIEGIEKTIGPVYSIGRYFVEAERIPENR
jgi:hypothetical protein